MIFCGIDPGLSGGMAIYDPTTKTLLTYPMPVGVKGSGAIHVQALIVRLCQLPNDASRCLVEEPFVLPKQGMASAMTIGENFGRILAALEVTSIPYRKINPATFRAAIGLPKGQDKELTARWVSSWAPDFTLPRGSRGALKDGETDAAALAIYASRMKWS